MHPSNLPCRVLANRAAARGGGTPLVIVAAAGPDGEPAPLQAWDDTSNEPVTWGYHFVNEEAGGRIVDYVLGLVFEDRKQLVAALFNNPAVLVEREEQDW